MKSALFTLAFAVSFTATLASTALANDGGMAYVDVQGVNPVTVRDGKKITVPDGSEIKFYGKDAEKFMKLLPVTGTALDAMVTPAERDLRRANDRGVAIVSDGWTILIDCTGVKVEGNETVTRIVKAPQVECAIRLGKNSSPDYKYDQLGDAFKMDLNDKTQLTCQ